MKKLIKSEKGCIAFLLAFSFSLFACSDGFAQSCEKNMLMTPDASSYAVIPSPKFSLPGAFTIEFWAQPSSFAPFSGLIEQTNKGDTGAFSIGFTSSDSIIVSLRLNNGITTLVTPSIPNIQDWQQYAVTFTPNDSIRIFINGILTTSKKTTAKNLIASTDSILIAHSELSGITFTGNIDELRFWNIAKTSADILASMNNSLVGNELGLKAYYSFDDDPANTFFHDFTGGKSEGKLLSSAALTASTSPVTGSPSAGYMLASKEQSIVFDSLLCSNQEVKTVHIYNRGPEQVQIDPASFLFGTVFSPTTTVFTLPADSTHSIAINISANPKLPGLYRDTLIIKSATVCGGILRIPVELRYDKVSIAFEDTVFKLRVNANRDLLPCDLPIVGATTLLRNTGTKRVKIISLGFSSSPAGIVVTNPQVPFFIDANTFQQITFTVQTGSAGSINTTLTATTEECSQTAAIVFQGKRIIPALTTPASVDFPSLHLPPTIITIDTTIFLKNTGTAMLSMNPALALQGGPGFQLLAPKSGLAQILPDSSLAIKIRFTTSTECGLFETAIHVQDQIDCGIDTLIPVSITVLGPDVSAANAGYDFGASCGAHDSTITIVNRSGRTVTLGKPDFSTDNIFSLAAGSLPKTLAPNDSVILTFLFAPVEPGTHSVTARFPLSPCGFSLLQLSGLLGVGDIALSDSVLDFGDGCDLNPGIKKITITNNAGRRVDITTKVLEGSQLFSITDPPLPFSLANNESKEITVQFNPAQRRTLAQARLNLYDSGCFVTRFSLRGSRDSANIPSSFTEFGTACPGQIGTEEITLQNQGYGDVTITSATWKIGGSFTAPNMTGTIIGQGSGKQFSFTFLPKDTGNFIDILQVTYAPCNDTAWFTVHGVGGPPATFSTIDTVLDFATLKARTTDSRCIILQNQSCIGLPISLDSIHGNRNAPFTIDPVSLGKIPDTVTSTNPVKVCFIFSPTKIGSFQTQDTIRIGDKVLIIRMSGSAGFDSLIFRPRTIDLGDVLIDSINTLPLFINNKGTYPAALKTVNAPTPDFLFDSSPQTIGGLSIDSVSFAPKHPGLQQSMITFHWENHFDTVFLIARGIEPGLAFPSSLIDFSKVRVGHDSVITVEVHNTLDSLITISNSFVNGKFQVSHAGSTGYVFAHDSNRYIITYLPDAESIDSGQLVIQTKFNGNDTLLLRGEGVEAHLHVDTTQINFGDVGIGVTKPYDLKVSNIGGYPLAITSIHKIIPEFDTSIGGVFLIPPDSVVTYQINFTPQRAIAYFDSLNISADAPEKNAVVSLRGKGVFAPLGIPEVTYTIPDEVAKVGDVIDVPINIAGNDLSLFNLDSFFVELSYDPTVIYFHDSISTENSLSSGFQMTFERLAHDSIIRISGNGNEIVASPGRLFMLRAEALLGPHDSTRIFIQSSDPKNTADAQSSSGSFIVSDCGNYRDGIIPKGNYSVSEIKPNPVSSVAHIEYEIGLNGNVTIELYDALGRVSKMIVNENQTQGKHSAVFSIDDIPSGEYVYVLKSLEYVGRGKMIIAK